LIAEHLDDIRENTPIKTLSDVAIYFPTVSEERWMSIKGIGEKVAKSLREWFSDANNRGILMRLHTLGVTLVFEDAKQGVAQIFENKTFVLTGELVGFTRDEAKAMIKKYGGSVSSSVSSKTSYVVAGENPGSKHRKALELGVSVLTEDEFKKLLQD
jgi:DNA ligase (NAD+)